MLPSSLGPAGSLLRSTLNLSSSGGPARHASVLSSVPFDEHIVHVASTLDRLKDTARELEQTKAELSDSRLHAAQLQRAIERYQRDNDEVRKSVELLKREIDACADSTEKQRLVLAQHYEALLVDARSRLSALEHEMQALMEANSGLRHQLHETSLEVGRANARNAELQAVHEQTLRALHVHSEESSKAVVAAREDGGRAIRNAELEVAALKAALEGERRENDSLRMTVGSRNEEISRLRAELLQARNHNADLLWRFPWHKDPMDDPAIAKISASSRAALLDFDRLSPYYRPLWTSLSRPFHISEAEEASLSPRGRAILAQRRYYDGILNAPNGAAAAPVPPVAPRSLSATAQAAASSPSSAGSTNAQQPQQPQVPQQHLRLSRSVSPPRPRDQSHRGNLSSASFADAVYREALYPLDHASSAAAGFMTAARTLQLATATATGSGLGLGPSMTTSALQPSRKSTSNNNNAATTRSPAAAANAAGDAPGSASSASSSHSRLSASSGMPRDIFGSPASSSSGPSSPSPVKMPTLSPASRAVAAAKEASLAASAAAASAAATIRGSLLGNSSNGNNNGSSASSSPLEVTNGAAGRTGIASSNPYLQHQQPVSVSPKLYHQHSTAIAAQIAAVEANAAAATARMAALRAVSATSAPAASSSSSSVLPASPSRAAQQPSSPHSLRNNPPGTPDSSSGSSNLRARSPVTQSRPASKPQEPAAATSPFVRRR